MVPTFTLQYWYRLRNGCYWDRSSQLSAAVTAPKGRRPLSSKWFTTFYYFLGSDKLHSLSPVSRFRTAPDVTRSCTTGAADRQSCLFIEKKLPNTDRPSSQRKRGVFAIFFKKHALHDRSGTTWMLCPWRKIPNSFCSTAPVYRFVRNMQHKSLRARRAGRCPKDSGRVKG